MSYKFKANDRIHFIGIGGCSMNGLAQILQHRGCIVEGSDKTTSPFTQRLAEVGIPVQIGQCAENVKDCDCVVYSAAIKSDNPERIRARELIGCIVMLIATVLALLPTKEIKKPHKNA